jgi:hypothetical protein
MKSPFTGGFKKPLLFAEGGGEGREKQGQKLKKLLSYYTIFHHKVNGKLGKIRYSSPFFRRKTPLGVPPWGQIRGFHGRLFSGGQKGVIPSIQTWP